MAGGTRLGTRPLAEQIYDREISKAVIRNVLKLFLYIIWYIMYKKKFQVMSLAEFVDLAIKKLA